MRLKNFTQTDICEAFKRAKNKALYIPYLANVTGTDEETVIEVLRMNDLYVRKCKCTICGKTFKRYLRPMCQECLDRVNELADVRDARKRQIEFELCQLEVRRWSLLRRLADFDRIIYAKKEAIKRLKKDSTHIE